MANPSDPFSQNVIGVTDLVQNETNKVKDGSSEYAEGLDGDKYDAFELKLSDEELLKLRDDWVNKYGPYEGKMLPIFERNIQSYLGKKINGQWLVDNQYPLAANIQFEAEETFLAASLSKNPEPVVYADNTPEGNAIASAVKTMLQFHADQLVLRKKLGVMVRQWSMYHLGVLKFGYNKKVGDVTIDNRKIEDFIFDPDGYVDAYGDFTSYLGERITITADKLIELYPKSREYVILETDGKMGSKVVYTEWHTDEFTFVTYKEMVLDKYKNIYFRYPEPVLDELGQPMVNPETGEDMIDEPRNHFAYPKKPYAFLSVYSLQRQPHDETGLIEQNIPNQNLITKRTEQIDYNISASNNGYALSEHNFNQETGKQAADARAKGEPILVPVGRDINEAIMPLPAQDLPQAVFNGLEINKNDLRTSWGVQGITAEPQDEDQTARGMILNQQHDTTRIGGGIGMCIEQVADNAFNWLVQLYYVFYDEQHFAAIMGNSKAVEYVTLSSQDLDRQIIVSVSADSLRPRDEVTEMNLAQALFDKGAIGPKTLLKMVNFPNPDESAADGVLYRIDPMAYFQINFPEYAQQLQQIQQAKMQQDMQNQAQSAGMNASAEANAVPPEQANGEPAQPVSAPPASSALSNVPLQ